ncbi:MAG: SH3 domain-containing protein [Acidobacteria bacterium]|nr:SH3 domain-containing protein [Acidobacteriota bacterium]
MKIFKTGSLVILLIFAASSVCLAQKGATARAAAAKAAQEKAQRAADEEAVRKMPDPGADTAFVVATRANIREEPDRTSRILLEVERGEALSLIEREPTGTWFRVIHVETAIEGWIDQSVIVNKLTANRYTAPDFEEEVTESDSNPTVKITNQERATDLNLRMNGVLYVIKANTTRSFTLAPGPYEYYGWSPGVRATFGKSTLSRGTIYSWSFFIRRR